MSGRLRIVRGSATVGGGGASHARSLEGILVWTSAFSLKCKRYIAKTKHIECKRYLQSVGVKIFCNSILNCALVAEKKKIRPRWGEI
jgi:hypothetical protein